MTYRITRLACAGCDVLQRVRVTVNDDVDTYPECPRCGCAEWVSRKSAPDSSSIFPPSGVPASLSEVFAPMSEAQEFWRDMQREQEEYYRHRFEQWQEARSEKAEVDRHREDTDQARMFREVWSIIGE